MKRLIHLVPLAAMLTDLVLFRVADSTASIADTPSPGNEAVSRVNEAGNPDSASATITVTRRTALLQMRLAQKRIWRRQV